MKRLLCLSFFWVYTLIIKGMCYDVPFDRDHRNLRPQSVPAPLLSADDRVFNVHCICAFFKSGFEKQQGYLENVGTTFETLQRIDEGYRRMQDLMVEHQQDGEFFMIMTGHHYRRWGGSEFEIATLKKWRQGLNNTDPLTRDRIKCALQRESAYDQLEQLNKDISQLIHSLHYFLWRSRA